MQHVLQVPVTGDLSLSRLPYLDHTQPALVDASFAAGPAQNARFQSKPTLGVLQGLQQCAQLLFHKLGLSLRCDRGCTSRSAKLLDG